MEKSKNSNKHASADTTDDVQFGESNDQVAVNDVEETEMTPSATDETAIDGLPTIIEDSAPPVVFTTDAEMDDILSSFNAGQKVATQETVTKKVTDAPVMKTDKIPALKESYSLTSAKKMEEDLYHVKRIGDINKSFYKTISAKFLVAKDISTKIGRELLIGNYRSLIAENNAIVTSETGESLVSFTEDKDGNRIMKMTLTTPGAVKTANALLEAEIERLSAIEENLPMTAEMSEFLAVENSEKKRKLEKENSIYSGKIIPMQARLKEIEDQLKTAKVDFSQVVNSSTEYAKEFCRAKGYVVS